MQEFCPSTVHLPMDGAFSGVGCFIGVDMWWEVILYLHPPKTNISELGKGETSTNYQFSGSMLVFAAYSKVQKWLKGWKMDDVGSKDHRELLSKISFLCLLEGSKGDFNTQHQQEFPNISSIQAVICNLKVASLTWLTSNDTPWKDAVLIPKGNKSSVSATMLVSWDLHWFHIASFLNRLKLDLLIGFCHCTKIRGASRPRGMAVFFVESWKDVATSNTKT